MTTTTRIDAAISGPPGAPREPTTPRLVSVVVAMSPAPLLDQLFGPGGAALAVPGSARLNDVPFASFESTDARAALAEADVLVTGWGASPLTDAQLLAAPRLRYVLHAGGDATAMLPASAAARDLELSNAGWVNGIPVAEFTFAMIVLANKQVFRAQRMYRERRTRIDREQEFAGSGNLGRTVGVIGASRIGRLVIERLQTLGHEVLLFDPYLDGADARRLGASPTPLDELLAASDVVTVHAPLDRSTVGMLDARRLGLLRDGATLINTARGAIIDQAALLAELRSGRIDAVLDVTDPDVLPAESELYTLPNVLLTPHVAGSMGHELRRIGDHVASELERVVAGLPLAFPQRSARIG